MTIKDDAFSIMNYAIDQAKPDKALSKYLKDISFHNGKLYVISIGKAAWLMASTAQKLLSKPIDQGFVITKYHHSMGEIQGFEIMEAGHPVLDENSIISTQRILEATQNLTEDDDIVFLLSGGGSALFEAPICSLSELQSITSKLLSNGADIVEINTIRKSLSKVKGGRFGKWCAPAHIHNFILSDVISNQLDSIASGPTVENKMNIQNVRDVNDKYELNLSEQYLSQPVVDFLDNVDSTLIGSVTQLCQSAFDKAIELGYHPVIINDHISCNDLDFCNLLVKQCLEYQDSTSSLAFIYGGETTVQIKGKGLGGRNQETAVGCIERIKNTHNTLVLSIGSDGTDGPTDAAGGYCDENTYNKCVSLNLDIHKYLDNNDSYHLLKKIDQLIITGPTNTNVNDLILILIKR